MGITPTALERKREQIKKKKRETERERKKMHEINSTEKQVLCQQIYSGIFTYVSAKN